MATIPNVSVPTAVTFSNYPFGVVATDSDEALSDDQDEAPLPPKTRGKPGRGRSRTRSRAGGGKPLKTKKDGPAYIGAIGVAKRDMDAATERAAAAAEERDRSGPPRKRTSPERSTGRPDQWCFRHSAKDTMRLLFVIEYKAAHKIDEVSLRASLEPDVAASLMEDVIQALSGTSTSTDKDHDFAAKLDIAKVFTQVYHYMIDYGLQYSYATTGYALIFFYLDPAQPATLYYHLEEPKLTVRSEDRQDIKHSAVALVLSFVLMAMEGKYMTNQWKTDLHDKQPAWPTPYDGMSVAPVDTTRLKTGTTLARRTAKKTAGCGDPHKQDNSHERDQDDGDPGPSSRPARTTGASTSTTAPTTQSSSATGASGSTTTQGSQQTLSSLPVLALPVDAPLSPSLQYCTQACLQGLKTGGAKDPHCPNVDLHRQCGAADHDSAGQQHPISAEQLRQLLIQQLSENMDHDFVSLERFGMYGAIGALFKVALSEYGYCFVGKGVQRAHRKQLEKEAVVYGSLEACQGRLVPVNLGMIQLVKIYRTECGAHISHLMLMSFAGESLWHHGRKTGDYNRYHDEMQHTLRELEPYGVKHGDVNNNNMVWNEELQRVMAIDFDRADVEVAVHVPVPPKRRTEQKQGQGLAKRKNIPNQHIRPQQAKRAKMDGVDSKENVKG